MNRSLIKQLNQDFESGYKSIMKPLYLKWSNNIDSTTVRLMFADFIHRKNHSRILDTLNKRKHRKLKFNKIKNELKMYKIEEELNNFIPDEAKNANV